MEELSKLEHDHEFYLLTDVAVYACECEPSRILVGDQEYIPVQVYKQKIEQAFDAGFTQACMQTVCNKDQWIKENL